MQTRKWNPLRREEVHRADLLALRATMAVLLKELIDSAPDREAAASKLRSAAEGVIRSMPNSGSVPPARKAAYVECAVDSAHRLVANAESIPTTH